MIRRADQLRQEIRTNARGGKGNVFFNHMLESAEYCNKGRLMGKIVIPPNASIGYHTHHDEMEIYYFISGKATVLEGDTTSILAPGDVMLTRSGESHAIENNGDEALVYIAIILSV